MTLQGHRQVWQLGKPSQNFFGQCYPNQPTAPIQQLLKLVLWIAPIRAPIWSPDGCNPQYKFWIDEDVIQIVVPWLREQHNGMVLTRHMHTYSLLAQGHRSGQRLCRNTGYGVKPSLFIMSNFHDLGINIYQKKEGIIFWTTLTYLVYATCSKSLKSKLKVRLCCTRCFASLFFSQCVYNDQL